MFSLSGLSIEDTENTLWDAIIVGTGMGGGAVGFGLAERGHKILFLEKGGATQILFSQNNAQQPEHYQPRLAWGLWPTRITTDVDNNEREIFHALGCGVGGSTTLYAATLERFSPIDFEPARNHKEVGDSTLPESWPISYQEMVPFYREAEALFNVCGTPDPLDEDETLTLRQPPELSKRDQHFYESFSKLGLHPYRQHIAIDYISGCEECTGFACAKDCKRDSEKVFLRPALSNQNALLLDNCEVTRLDADQNRVNRVECSRNGKTLHLKAKVFVVSAGAMFSPVLLLKSRNEFWPQGLANSSGLVGCNLMFHVGNQFAIWPKGKFDDKGPRKTLAFRDFYVKDGTKFGSVQSVGVSVGYYNILYYLYILFDASPFHKLKFIKPFLRIPAKLATKLFGRADVYTAMLEDLPYVDNRVVVDASKPSGIRVEYNIRDELKQRAGQFRSMVKKSLAGHLTFSIDRGTRLNYGHPCGTCRFGSSSQDSVLDKNNRAHDLENLYVVDSSFFPSSAGVNPGLTIAANGLRVADVIHKKLNGDVTLNQAPFESDALRDYGNPSNPAIFSPEEPEHEVSRSVSGKVILVTGAGSGLGRALSKGFAGDGAFVVGIGRTAEALKETGAGISEDHFTWYSADVSDPDQISAMVKKVIDTYGHIDILINNAAVYPKGLLCDEDIYVWWDALKVNVLGCAAFSRAVLPHMESTGFGRIINVGSFADRSPLPGSSAYAVSKGALHTLTKAIAVEVNRRRHPNISVSEFFPGVMKTQMGSEMGVEPDKQYQHVKDIIIAAPGRTHGAMFSNGEEIKPPKGLKAKIKERLFFWKGD